MASPAYEQILNVQALDLSLRQLRHQYEQHPIRQELVANDSQISEIDARLTDVDERRHDLERRRKRFEDEAGSMKTKRASIEQKLYGGEVTGSKELLALQDEETMLKGKQDELEEQEIEVMEELESVDAERDEIRVGRDQLAELRAALESDLEMALGEIETDIGAVVHQRADAVEGADPALLERYEQLRDSYDGVAVARLVNGSCDGCHIQLSAVAVDQMTKMADDAVVTCEECGRLLVH